MEYRFLNKFEDDIGSLGARIEKLKGKDSHHRKKKTAGKPAVYAIATGFRLSIELLAGVICGTAIGYFLDKALGTKPLLMVIFLFIGSMAGFLNVYRIMKNEDKKD